MFGFSRNSGAAEGEPLDAQSIEWHAARSGHGLKDCLDKAIPRLILQFKSSKIPKYLRNSRSCIALKTLRVLRKPSTGSLLLPNLRMLVATIIIIDACQQ